MYYEIQALLKQVPGLKPIHDEEAAVKYVVWDKNQWVSYDDSDTFKAKLDWANSIGIGGSMIWAVDTDDDNYSAMSGLIGKEVSHVDTQTPEMVVSEQTIAKSLAGENGQDCKVLKDYSCRPVRDLRCGSGEKLIGWDRDGCKKDDEEGTRRFAVKRAIGSMLPLVAGGLDAEAHATRAKRQKLPFLLVVAHLVVAILRVSPELHESGFACHLDHVAIRLSLLNGSEANLQRRLRWNTVYRLRGGGDEESAEAYMAAARQVVALFEYLNHDAVVTNMDGVAANVRRALRDIGREFPEAEGLAAHWDEAYPYYFAQVSQLAREFMGTHIDRARIAFEGTDLPYRDSILEELKKLKDKIPKLKYPFE
ncbi:hypothetical protein NQ176_g4845 [Zarea fungicola]|uniref:Uncharacterized protein n=1 Tax=Zarea fungicola TaxID=93591 RepID=A0ACC1NCV5_9HYPO|nr:hypothetical protein NQ176_g4845 [Lecanicillium fungicola]